MLAERFTLNFQAEHSDDLVLQRLRSLEVTYTNMMTLGEIDYFEVKVSPSMPFIAGQLLFYSVTFEVETYVDPDTGE